MLDESTRLAAAEGRVEILSETQLWERLGLVDAEQNVRRLYTPAMLAELLKVSVATVRRWHRKGLIVPARQVHRLPYFDFQEVATARRLAELVAGGASPTAIEKKLGQLARFMPEVERPLAQLSVIVEGKQLLLRQGEGLIEPGGQLRFDFDTIEHKVPPAAPVPIGRSLAPSDCASSGAVQDTADTEPSGEDVLSIDDAMSVEDRCATPDDVLRLAADLEDEGNLSGAADMYRAALAAGGPDAEICFLLAEVLYRLGDLPAARERYYGAIELDEDYVEARANLGCVLVETGRLELAVAAFEGALRYHDDYPDVHYHLARTLDELRQSETAEFHWRQFLTLAPESPWAEEAKDRLGLAGV